MNLGELLIEFGGDFSNLDASIEKAKKKAIAAAKDIEKNFNKSYSLKVNVDDSELTALNKHLDLKVSHFRQVQNFFDNNPLKIRVDDSELTEANKKLDEITRSGRSGSSSSSSSSSNSSFVSGTKSSLDEIEQSFNRMIKGIARTAASPFQSVVRGFFEGTGQTLSKGFGESLKKKVESELKFTFDNLGDGLGNFITQGVKNVNNKIKNQTNNSQVDLSNLKNTNKQPEYVYRTTPQQANQAFSVAINKQGLNVAAGGVNVGVSKQGLNVSIQKAATEQFEKVVNSAIQQIKTSGFNSATNVDFAKARFEEIKNQFKEAYKKFQEALSKGNYELAKAYSDSILKVSVEAKKEIDKIKADIAKSGVKSGFGSEIATAAGSVKGVITSRYENPTKRAINQAKSIQDDVNIGKDVVRGVAEGLKGKAPVVRESALLAASILVTLKKELGIESPSRKARALAVFVGQGFVSGLQSSKNLVVNASKDLSNAAMSGLKSGADGIGKAVANATGTSFSARRRLIESQKLAQEGSEAFYDNMWRVFGQNFRRKILKGMPAREASPLIGEMAGFGLSAASMVNPLAGLAGLAPLAIPAAPAIVTAAGLQNMLSPLVSKIIQSLQLTEPMTARLNFLGGSKDAGEREVNYARSVSEKYGVGVQPLLENYSKMAIAARGTKLEGEGIKELFEGISASVQALKMSSSDAELVFYAYNQILSKGKVSMEELRQQLGEKFPPTMNVFAKALGVSVGELGSLVEKGALLSEDVLPKVAKVLLQDFGKAAQNSSGNFLTSLTKFENVGFDIALSLSKAFGGMFASIVDVGTNALKLFKDNLETIGKLAGVAVIGIGAQVAVGLQVIMSSPAVAGKLAGIQNFLISSFKSSLMTLTPFFVGIVADVADDFLGAQNSIMDNMSKGVGNLFIGLFTNLDNLFRDLFNKPLFDPSSTNDTKGIFEDIKKSVSGFFKIIPSGLVEMGALVIMFEQVTVLGKMLLTPMFTGISSAVARMTWSFLLAVTSGKSLTGMLRVLIADSAMAQARMVAMGVATKAAFAAVVLAFARGDFSDPLIDGIHKAHKNIVNSLDSIGNELAKLGNKAEIVGNKLATLKLPSKGIELNPGALLGISADSFKSDDLTDYKNYLVEKTPDLLKPLTELLIIGPVGKIMNKTSLFDYGNKRVKEEADSLGVGSLFTGKESQIKLNQQQILNQARSLNSMNKDILNMLDKNSLSPDKINRFINKDVKNIIDATSAIDTKVKELGQKRSKLALIDTAENRKQVKEIDLEINKLNKERKAKIKPLQAILGNVDGAKKYIEEQVDAIEKSELPYEVKDALLNIFKPSENALKNVFDFFKENNLYKLIQPAEGVWQPTIDKLKEVEKAFERTRKASELAFSEQEESVYNASKTDEALNRSLQQLSLYKLETKKTQLESIAKIKDDSLKLLLTDSESNNGDARKQEIKDLRENLDKDLQELAQTKVDIAKQRSQTNKQLRDASKAINEYYLSIEKQAKELALTAKEISNEVRANDIKSKFKSALIGFQDDFVSQYMDSLLQIIDTLNQPLRDVIQAQKDKLQNSNSFNDTLKQGTELQKQLDSIPVGSIPLSQQIQQSTQQNLSSIPRKLGKVSWVENSSSSMDSHPGHVGDDIFAPIGSKFYSPVSGTVVQSRVGGTKNTDDANPLVPGYQPQQLVIIKLDMPIEFEGKKITHFNMRHLLDRNVEVGQKVKMGDLIGTIGEAGGRGSQFGPKIPGTPKDADAAHLHIEYSPGENDQRNSLRDAQASKLTAILSQQFKGIVAPRNLPQSTMSQSNNSDGILWGRANQYSRSDFSGLTSIGKKAKEALKNPNVRAFLDAIAVAEVGDIANSTGGYGYLFGDNGRETFNVDKLSTHPKQRRRSGKYVSSATGRYQTMDFVWDDDTAYGSRGLGLRDFKPQSQEVLAVGRMMYRGILDEVMKGNIQGALRGAGREWASIQGNPYGQGTTGGKTSVFLSNFEKFKQNILSGLGGNLPNLNTPYSLNTSTNTANTNTINTNAAQNQLNQSINIARQNLNQQNANTDARFKSNLNLSQVDAQLQQGKADLNLQDGLKNVQDINRQLQRNLEDLAEQIGYNTPEKEFTEGISKISQSYYDYKQSLERKKKELTGTLTKTEKWIKVLEATDPNTLPPGFDLEGSLSNLRAIVPNLNAALAQVDNLILESANQYNRAIRDFQNKTDITNTNRYKESIDALKQSASQALKVRASSARAFMERNLGNLSQGNPIELEAESGKMDADIAYSSMIRDINNKIRNESDQQIIKMLEAQKQNALVGLLRAYKDIDAQSVNQTIDYGLKLREDNLAIQDRISQSRNSVINARSEAYKMYGMDRTAQKYDYEAAVTSENLDYERQILDIDRFAAATRLAADKVKQLKENLRQANEIRLDNIRAQFDPMTEIIKNAQQSTEGFFKSAILNSGNLGDAFKGMVNSIIDNLATMASQMLSQGLFDMLGLGGKSGGGLFTPSFGGDGGGGFLGGLFGGGGGSGIWGSVLSLFGFADGGMVPAYATGGIAGKVADALRKEQTMTGRKPKLVVVSEGERILNHQQTEQWNRMQSANKLNFASGGVVGGSDGIGLSAIASGGTTVNVPMAININTGSDTNVDPVKLKQAIDNVVKSTIKNETRPGGSINRPSPYSR